MSLSEIVMECVDEQSAEVGLGDEDKLCANTKVVTITPESTNEDNAGESCNLEQDSNSQDKCVTEENNEMQYLGNDNLDVMPPGDQLDEGIVDSTTKMLVDDDDSQHCYGSTLPQEDDNQIEDVGMPASMGELIDGEEYEVMTQNDNSGDEIQTEEMESRDIGESKYVTEENDKGDILIEESIENKSSVNTHQDIKDDNKPSPSTFQRLASMGVSLSSSSVVKEKSNVESKENVLKKLVSRGAVSITSASGASFPHSVGNAVSITPTKNIPKSSTPSKTITSTAPKTAIPPSITGTPKKQIACTTISSNPTTPDSTKPKYKPGPKSAKLKQNAKKLKIDPRDSEDIEKDFTSIIHLLSDGGSDTKTCDNATSVQESSEKNSDPDVVLPDEKPDPDLKTDNKDEMNESFIDQGTNQSHPSDINDDRSPQGTDTESHDGSKSVGHSSDQTEDIEDKVPSSSKMRNAIDEGSAEILLSASKKVFYNKVQEFNRDMSIAALTVFSEMHQQDPRTRNRGKKRKALESDTDTNGQDENEKSFQAGKKSDNGITILEALSATGLRSIRYAKEIPGVKQVYANDMSEDAVETIKKNIQHNKVEDLVSTTMSDASLLMYQRQATQEWFDAIDLDPYGCPSRFLDSAVQAVRDGGLLLVTCTDMAVLAGNTPETCYVKYGAVSLRTPCCHEMALRIALQCVESYANRYGRYIVPLLAFSADFYIRMILQVYTSPVTCKRTTSKLSMVYQCVGCHTHTLQPLGRADQDGQNTQLRFSLGPAPPVNRTCYHCNHKHHMGGPIWSAPLHSSKFLDSMLRVAENARFGTAKRMQGMLEVIREELPDVPLYYTISGLCSKLHCQNIPLGDIRSAILNAGYRVSSSHASPTAVKTNAPSRVIWDIMRCWVHINPVSEKRLVPGSVSAAIILEPPQLIANFDHHPKARSSSSMRKLLRYQQNPEKNWGPGMRARCNNDAEDKDEKRKANQNKKTKKGIDIIEVVTIDDDESPKKTTEEAAATSTTP